MIQHLASTWADGALIQLFTEIGDQSQHAALIVFRKMRQHWRGVIFLQRILPQFAPLFRQRLFLGFGFIITD
ncbi:hypothetical protein D3C81_2100480 [compost metagenome]